MRDRGALIVVGGLLFAALGVVAILAQPTIGSDVLAPSPVASISQISHTPLAVRLTLQRGADRILQRQRTGGPCSPHVQMMGCPASVGLASVTVFLVRDDADMLHAFIGEDPRNGCALEWLPSARSDPGTPEVFHDVCHGSIYDRAGRRVGGPSPWNLNELVTTIEGDHVWADPRQIVTGACPSCVR